MKLPRIHCDLPLAAGTQVSLRGERHHYLTHVLRLSPDSPLRLFNNDDGEFACRVSSIERHASHILCEHAVAPSPPSRLHAVVYIALAKGRSMDLAVQKATELGAAAVQPVIAARSVGMTGSWERRLLHWQGIARSACEQCGRTDLPRIATPVMFEEMTPPQTGAAFVLDPDSERSLVSALRDLSDARVGILIGPEGGLTEDEVAAAQERGFTPVSLGSRLLRVETAVAAALSVTQAFLGDFGGDFSAAADQ